MRGRGATRDTAEPGCPGAVRLRELCACRELWLAVMLDAIRGYRRAVLRHGREAAAYTEDGQWLASDELEVGAFAWVCEILKADPEAVRERLAGDRLLSMDLYHLSQAGDANRRKARRGDD